MSEEARLFEHRNAAHSPFRRVPMCSLLFVRVASLLFQILVFLSRILVPVMSGFMPTWDVVQRAIP
jgi:hypothetical protein